MNAISAKGLFRATGKTATVELPREKDDFYPTPPDPTRAILRAEHDRLKQFPVIWEPAAGDGAMAREMQAVGHVVHASDLIDRGCGAEIRSFYDFDRDSAPSNAILTNPPFDQCHKDRGWVRHALETIGASYMGLLLPVQWPAALERARVWAEYPPARVYMMRWRIDFTGQGASPMTQSWYVWDAAHSGPTELHMLDRTDPRQADMFGEGA